MYVEFFVVEFFDVWLEFCNLGLLNSFLCFGGVCWVGLEW